MPFTPLQRRNFREFTKEAVMNVYTNGEQTCHWCGQGDLDMLTIDHINNDGVWHRKFTTGHKMAGIKFYDWLVKFEYPKGFQVLCYNCNMKKAMLYRREQLLKSNR